MWLLGWVAFQALNSGLPRMKLLTVGLIWEFVLAMIILYLEEENFSMCTISRRFWQNHRLSPSTGEKKKSLWWWIIPLILLVAFVDLALRPGITNLWVAVFLFFAEPKGYDGSAMFAPEVRSHFVGDWGLLGLFFVLAYSTRSWGRNSFFAACSYRMSRPYACVVERTSLAIYKVQIGLSGCVGHFIPRRYYSIQFRRVGLIAVDKVKSVIRKPAFTTSTAALSPINDGFFWNAVDSLCAYLCPVSDLQNGKQDDLV
jgi:hypothetical protein